MSYPIHFDLLPGLPKTPFRHGIGAYEGVVAHATDDYEATAKNIRDFESRNWKNAFVQFAVDWNEIRQIADTNYEAYGAGHVANQRFLHVELCQTKDAAKFKESYKRYVWLIAYLLKQKRLGVTYRGTLWGHDDVRQVLGDTNHTDPYGYLASHGISKSQFIKDVQDAYDPKPVQMKEEDDMLEKAIVVNAFGDAYAAEPLAKRLKCPIFFRDTAQEIEVAKTIYVCGGSKDGLKGSNFVVLTGADRWEAAKAIGDFTKRQ